MKKYLYFALLVMCGSLINAGDANAGDANAGDANAGDANAGDASWETILLRDDHQENKSDKTNTATHNFDAQTYNLTAIFLSLFKSSCAATIAGLGTYFAVGFYNKGKKKEEQCSQKKWALGAAAIAGMGTFAFLHWSANADKPSDPYGYVEIC